MDRELTCPRCGNAGSVGEGFTRYDNADPLHCVAIYRCTACGHSHAPLPEDILEAYWREVLGIQAV